MKRHKFSLLALAALLAACSNGTGGGGTPGGGNPNPPSSPYYLRVSMNGAAPKDFSHGASASLLGPLARPEKLEFGGLPAEAKNHFPAFSIQIWTRDKTIQGGQTYLPHEANAGANYNLDGFDFYESAHVEEKDFTLRIDLLTATETKGSFAGTLKRTTNGELMRVTGEYYLPIQQD